MFGLIAGGLAVGTVLAGPVPDGAVSPCVYAIGLRAASITAPIPLSRDPGDLRDTERTPEDAVPRVRDRAVWSPVWRAACPPVIAPRLSGTESSSAATPAAVEIAEAHRVSLTKGAGKNRVVRKRRPGDIAAAAALRWLGTPYSWGGGGTSGPTRGIGRGARTVGFDCSGLTKYAWAKAGVRLGHYTGAQFRQGRRVRKPRRGDLVFFGGGGGDPTHVGLYLSRGVMIHAPKTGDVVKRTRFRGSSYYMSRYRGAVRPKG